MRNAIGNDPSVASHYTDFDVSRAEFAILGQQRWAYVSYRIGNEIFWTSKMLSLHKGETLITDGTHEARARCGNRISATPQSPVSSQEPAIDAFESTQSPDFATLPNGPDFLSRHFGPQLESIPEIAPSVGLEETTQALTGIPTSWGGPIPPLIVPWGSPPPLVPGGPPSPPILTPEPGTGLLLLLALSGCWLVPKIRRG